MAEVGRASGRTRVRERALRVSEMNKSAALPSVQAIMPADLPEPMGYSHAVRAGDFLFPSGLMATDFVNGIASEARIKPGRPLDVRPVKQQTRYIYRTLKRVMEAAGSSLDDIVRLDQFTLSRETATDYLDGRNEFLLKDRPASTLVPVAGLLLPEAGIEVDAIGIVPRPGFAKSVAKSDKIVFNVGGGYSQSVMAGDFVFLAGCTASDHIGAGAYPGAPGTGLHPEARVDPNYWYGSEIKAQTRYIVAKKLGAMLEAAGCTLDDVVRAQVYILDMVANWAGFQEAWSEFFPKRRPALTVYPVTAFGSRGALIEISFIAVKPGSALSAKVIETPRAAPPLGPCPQAVKVGPYLFFSTILAADENGLAPEAAVDSNFPWDSIPVKKQMTHMLRSVEAICHAAGGDLGSVVKRWAMHTQAAEFAPAMEVWREAFTKTPPASTTIIVNAPLAVPDCSVALDLIGYIP
jgi:enamine deaminase RidA (YjgF/YER057c/UK114 family)